MEEDSSVRKAVCSGGVYPVWFPGNKNPGVYFSKGEKKTGWC